MAVTRVAAVRRRAPWLPAAGGRWLPALIAGVAITVTIWGLTLPLGVTLRGDELTSLFLYSARGPAAIWGSYIPNDHMFYELLTWGLRALTGDHSAASVRFWAVVPAAAASIITAAWLWRRLDPWVAAVFTVLVCAAPAFTDLSDEGRGYGLMFLGAVLMLIGADWAARTKRREGLAVFCAGAVTGIWTSPIIGVAFVAFAILLIAKLGWRRDLVLALAFVAVATFAFYAPVLGDMLAVSKEGSGQRLGLFGFITRPLTDLLQPSVQVVIRPLNYHAAGIYAAHLISHAPAQADIAADAIGAGLVALGAATLLRDTERFLVTAVLWPTLFVYVVLEILRTHIISRHTSFLLPGLLILIAAGLVGLARRAARTPALAGAVVVLGVVLCAIVIDRGYRLTTFYAATTQAVYSNQPSAFAPYLDPRSITLVRAPELEQMACRRPAAFVLLYYQHRPMPLATAECLKARGVAEVTAVPLASAHRSVPGLVLDVAGKREPRAGAKPASIASP